MDEARRTAAVYLLLSLLLAFYSVSSFAGASTTSKKIHQNPLPNQSIKINGVDKELLLNKVLANRPSLRSLQNFQSLLSISSSKGFPCVSCTLIVSLIDQVAEIHQIALDKLLDQICDWFPGPVSIVCTDFVNTYGNTILSLLLQGLNADDVCQFIGFCDPTSGCRLWPQKKETNYQQLVNQVQSSLQQELDYVQKLRRSNKKETPWDWLWKEIQVLAQQHEPIFDFDSDLYSEFTEAFRGSYWRGRDCNDFDAAVYPGKDSSFEITNPLFDLNCNGIFGVDDNGVSYEQKFCSGTDQRGVIILGDSAAAHFHIPVPYMHAPDINETTYAGFMDVLETEFDWPQFSWSTGHLNTTHDCPGPMDSIYLRLWKRNRCNHLDFQNIGVNGADTGAMTSIENSLKRNNATDKPLLVFYALIGNDVCHPEHSLDRMTTPQQFYTNVMTSLAFLDQRLPNGSHVVFLGLVDGRILWDTLHNQTHPIGTSYARVYDFLNCLELNPCWAWLNSNETIRNAGSARAAQLNDVYAQIVAKFNSRKYFKNFDMAYLPFPLPQVVKKWVRAGGKVADLIEPIDGFHPSQLGNSLFAGEIWDLLEQNYPEFLGSVNPHNEEIARIFGNQGGY